MENMKTIAVIESCDTKFKEAKFISDFIKNEGLNALVINTATGPAPSYNYDISREEIAESYGTPWEEMEPKSKGEKIDYMKDAVAAYVVKLYEEGKIDGIISVGGLQNTVMAANAMQKLPIGFPKVMATTVASGTRKFDLVVGDKDITVMPAICDFTGLNIVTRQVISNACACCVGMVKCAGQVLTKGDKPVVAVTLMGVTNTGAVAAVEELEKMGLEVIGFHATGVGGATMEDMAANGLVDGILDLTLHELTSEYFGGGFSYGPKAKIRLVESVEKKVPLVISLGGLDFVDFSTSELPDRMDERKYMLHNANTAHIKILPEEAEALGKILAERLSKVTYPVKLLIPTKGMRHNTLEGQELYEPKSDSVLIQTIIENVNDNVEVIVIPHNLNTPEFGVKAAHYIVDEMKNRANYHRTLVRTKKGGLENMDQKAYEIAEKLVIASKRAYNRGIQTGSGGNVSARIPGTETMLVKASGGSLGDCTPEGFLITDFDGNVVEGAGKPTREALLHGYIYKLRPDVQSVVHVHSPYAIGWSSSKKDLPLVTWHSKLKNPEGYPTLDVHAAMVRPEDVPMVEAMFKKTPNINAFLLADHGVVAMGKDPLAAEHTAELVEETAQVAILDKVVEKLGL